VTLEDFASLTRNGSISREVRGQKHGVWAEPLSPNCGHGGTHTELSCFIRGSAHDGAIPPPCNHYGLAAQMQIVPLLYGRVECVHIDMNDLAHGNFAHNLIPEFGASASGIATTADFSWRS
jgi:hypothetical protein